MQRKKSLLARIASVARHPLVLGVFGFAIMAWAIARITRFRTDAPFTPAGDAGIVFEKSLSILSSARYPASLALGNLHEVFPYPPPAVLIFGKVAGLGASVFMGLWSLMMVAGLFAAIRFSLVNEACDVRRDFIALMPAVIILAHNPIEFDLVNINNNLIVLALTMASFALMPRAPVAAGLLLALPITIKLYSGALLLWAVVYRPRAAVICVIALVGLWLVLPLEAFGVTNAIALYRGWREQLAIVNGAWIYDVPAGIGPPLIALRRAAAWLTSNPPYAPASAVALVAMQAAWIATLLAYTWCALRRGRVSGASRAALADWSVLLIAPLPFSPWLEPYHAVAMIPALVLCVLIGFDDRAPSRSRALAGAACIAILVLKAMGTPFEVRGLLFGVQFAVLTLSLAAMRGDLARADVGSGQPCDDSHAAVAGGSASTE